MIFGLACGTLNGQEYNLLVVSNASLCTAWNIHRCNQVKTLQCRHSNMIFMNLTFRDVFKTVTGHSRTFQRFNKVVADIFNIFKLAVEVYIGFKLAQVGAQIMFLRSPFFLILTSLLYRHSLDAVRYLYENGLTSLPTGIFEHQSALLQL